MARPSKSYSRPAVEPLESRNLFTTHPVNILDGYGLWSMRGRLNDVVAGDTIDLRSLRGAISVPEPLYIKCDLTILGPGPGLLTLAATGQEAAFIIEPGHDVRIEGLSIDNANNPRTYGGGVLVWDDPDTDDVRSKLTLSDVNVTRSAARDNGGGLSADACDVTLVRCRFSGNSANGVTGANGGGVYVGGGSLTAIDCTFDNNSVRTDADIFDTTAMGGGVAIVNGSASSFTNCTFAGNSAAADVPAGSPHTIYATAVGGGLGVAMTGDLALTNCTFSGNTTGGQSADTFGGGFGVVGFGTYDDTKPTTLKVVNTVIAGNTATVAPDAFGLDVSASLATANLKNNIIGVATDSGLVVGVNGNRGGTTFNPLDAKLDALANNGGPVPTMAPRNGSPVLGVGSPTDSPRRDARGYVRSPSIDAGAFEKQDNYAPGLTVWPDDVAAVDVPYASRIAATDVDGDPITFTLVNGPSWLQLVDDGNGSARLSGAPSVLDAGPAEVSIKASDGQLTWDEAFTMTVTSVPVSLSATGVLRVIGTEAADAIRVWQPRGSGQTVRVRAFGKTKNYSASVVKSIQIFGRSGDDTIVSTCADVGSYIQAGDGNDTIVGSDRPDSITAAAGDDSVLGLGGDDWIDGNSGRDYINGGGGADRLYGGNSRDILEGGAGGDVLYGEAGNNVYLIADGERDRVFGTNPATDIVEASDAKDILYGALNSKPPVRRR